MTSVEAGWRLTRSRPARRAFEALSDLGVTVARLERFERGFGVPIPAHDPPDGIAVAVASPATPRPERADRPEAADTDLVVSAVHDGTVVGIQPIVTGGSAVVSPLARRLEFDGAYLWGLYVDPAWRRRGTATALVSRALSELADRTTAASAHTLVGADNLPSKRVLRSAGFERRGLRSYYRVGPIERRTARAVGPD